jgi:hypothetical protein
MDGRHSLRLSPEMPDTAGGGGGSQDQPSAPAAPPASRPAQPSAQPAPAQPAGRQISEDEYARYQRQSQQLGAANESWRRFADRGYKSYDDIHGALDRLQHLEGDDVTKRVLDALQQPATPNEPEPGSSPTLDQISQMIRSELQTQQSQIFESQHGAASAQETSLLSEAATDARFKSIFRDGDGNPVAVDDAYQGKAGLVGALCASFLDNYLFNHAQKYDNGQAAPVTDPAIHKQARDSLFETLQQIKAMALLEASTSQPAQPSGTQPQTGERVRPEGEPDYMSDHERAQKKLHEEAEATFMQEFRRLTQGGGVPASQGK